MHTQILIPNNNVCIYNPFKDVFNYSQSSLICVSHVASTFKRNNYTQRIKSITLIMINGNPATMKSITNDSLIEVICEWEPGYASATHILWRRLFKDYSALIWSHEHHLRRAHPVQSTHTRPRCSQLKQLKEYECEIQRQYRVSDYTVNTTAYLTYSRNSMISITVTQTQRYYSTVNERDHWPAQQISASLTKA